MRAGNSLKLPAHLVFSRIQLILDLVVHLKALLHHCLDFLWAYSPPVNADVVDQAGEEGAWGTSTAGAQIQTAGCLLQTAQWCSVLGNLSSVNV